jgi:hypothetical protein
MTKPAAIVFLDRQHAGKCGPSTWADRGAAFDFDGRGTGAAWNQEAGQSGRLALELESAILDRARAMGRPVAVVLLSDGPYRSRHARVNDAWAAMGGPPSVYLALHYNAADASARASARYGLVLPDYRSGRGRVLADAVAGALAREWSGVLDRVQVQPAAPGDWTANAYATIAGVRFPVALCLEPGFMLPAHAPLFGPDGPSRTADAVAGAVLDFLFPGGGKVP